MNIIQLQEALKDMSENQLAQEMQSPSGVAPSYLVLSELERRQKMKQRYMENQQPQTTVSDDILMKAMQGMMPQEMTQPMPQPMPEMMPEMMPQQMMPEESANAPIQMSFGGILGRGLASILSRGAKPKTLRTPVQSQINVTKGGEAILPVNPNMLPGPYLGPQTAQGGIGRKLGMTALGATPLGAALYGLFGSGAMDDSSSISGALGLTEEEYYQMLAELDKAGLDVYPEKAGDGIPLEVQQIAAQIRSSRSKPGGREEVLKQIAAMQKPPAQQAAQQPSSPLQDLMKRLEEREKQQREMAKLQFGLDMVRRGSQGESPLAAASGAGISALPAYASAGDERMNLETQIAIAQAKEQAKGKGVTSVKDLIDISENLSKQIADPMIPESDKQKLRALLSSVNARIQLMAGIGGGQSQQDLGELMLAAIQQRQNSAKQN
jgi:hypothetical protein